MTPSEVIREARSRLFERGWTQGTSIGPDGSLCAFGALMFAGRCLRTSLAARTYLVAALPAEAIRGVSQLSQARSVVLWNDQPERTFGEVVDLFDRAEKLAESDEVAS